MSGADELGRGGGGASIREQKQIEAILDNVDNVEAFPADWRDRETGVEYLYRNNKIIVRDSNLSSVLRGLGRRKVSNSVDQTVPLAGATRVNVNPGKNSSVLDELDRIEADEGVGAAGPDHLLYVCVHACAAIEPEPVTTTIPIPPPREEPGPGGPGSPLGGGVIVRIIDTGLVEGADSHEWMTGVTGEPDVLIGRGGLIHHDGGHGTFTAGCVRVMAPQAEVHVVNATSQLPLRDYRSDELGAVFESDLANLLRRELVADPGDDPVEVPDIIVVNFAGTTRSGRPPVALAGLYDRVIRHISELVILAPSGNEGDTRKNWPAAFPWVVSVGALDENQEQRAGWSNYGRTVDVYARGDQLVNAFGTGRYRPTWDGEQHEPVSFDGMARWSGTSFATPLVAGLLAGQMSTTDQTSPQAWTSLAVLAEQQRIVGVGPVLRTP